MTQHPSVEQERTILQLVLIDETGDSYYRMRWPAAQVAAQAPTWRVISLDARAEERFEWALAADVLIVYQSNDLDLLPIIEQRRTLGKKTLAEYNDNFYDPPPASPVFEPWSSPLIWQSYERFMQQCDGLIVTGPGLKELFKGKSNSDIHILENHLPFDPPPFEEGWSKPKKKTGFGWAGSLGHIADVVAIIPLLRELIEESPELMFHLMGNEAIPGLLGLPEKRFKYTNWGTMAEYHEFWSPVHIGFAPLLDTPYNRCRSDIKAVEMASHGVLPILQKRLPYENFIAATDAPTFETASELKELILKYVGDKQALEEATRRCYEYVKEQRVGESRRERLNLYASFCPEEPSSYAWPMEKGCHEIQGTTNGQLRFGAVLAKAQALIQQQKRPEALQIIRSALDENPFTPELALAELNNLRATNGPALRERVDQYVSVFPRDLRFRLFRVICTATVPERVSEWKELTSFLESESEPYVRFFQADVVKLFVRNLSRIPELLEVGKRLMNLMPDSAELRLQIAAGLERAGDIKMAHEQFTWLLKARQTALPNVEFLKGVELSYLMTWESALAARLGEKKKTKKSSTPAKPKEKTTKSKKKETGKKKSKK